MSHVTLKRKTYSQKNQSGHNGFSLNGTSRGIGVGKEYSFSTIGTRYKGSHPVGGGGCCGNYLVAQPITNTNRMIVKHVPAQSSVSNYAMLRHKHKWIHTGQYPNYWVKNDNKDSKNQTTYIQQKVGDSMCVKPSDVTNNIVNTGPTLCHRTPALFTFNDMMKNAPYTKPVHTTMSSSQYQLFNKCADNAKNKYSEYSGNPLVYC